jgi:YD repeat-containing protein
MEQAFDGCVTAIVSRHKKPVNYTELCSYSGHGRVSKRQIPVPIGGPGTTYTYYADDKVKSMTDARGATTSYEYNKRGLLTKMSYDAPPPAQWQSQIKIPGPTTFSYDEAGIQTKMTDEYGSIIYEYDTLSRLKAETRYFSEAVPQAPAGNQLKLQYTYTSSGQLKGITDPFGEYIGYSHDGAGRLASVGGILPGGEQVQYATNAQYRAWGALKGLDYGTWTANANEL